MSRIGIGVIGAGYWGPNLIRNIVATPGASLQWVCDLDDGRAQRFAAMYAGVRATTRAREVLDDDGVVAVAIATPAATHAELAIAALRAGKHVLIEKPLAASVAEAERMVAVAGEERRVLMCDHTYCYTSAVQHIAKLVRSGAIGDVLFVDSVRINLGLIQPDVNVIWDLAPHDLSILDFVLPPERAVVSVSANGADPIGAGQACVGHLNLELNGGALAHVHVNWLSPTKVRTMIIGGSKRTLLWDDLNPTQRVSVFDRGVDLDDGAHDARFQRHVSYRIGDMHAPALRESEALGGVVADLVAAAQGEREPLTGGASGLRVLRVLEAATASLARRGAPVSLKPLAPFVMDEKVLA